MTHVSVFEVFANSTRTFRNSFRGLVFTYLIGFILFGVITWAIGAYYAIPWDLKRPWETINILPYLSMQAYIALYVVFAFFLFIFPIWQILIVKNNLFHGENRIWEALEHSVPKAILVVFGTLFLALFIGPIYYLVMTKYPAYMPYLPLGMAILTPFFVNFYFSLILQEGTMFKVFRFSLGAAVTGYFKTIISFVIYAVAEALFIFLLVILFLAVQLVVKFLMLPVFVLIVLLLLMYIFVQGFTIAYFVETCYAVSVEYESAQEDIRIKRDKKRKAKDDIPEKYNKEGMLTLEDDSKIAKAENKKENKAENKTDGKADAK